ncbi:uracil-DNA glycosylase [Rubellimicrobium rubrum]|uniref:Uracil-DNA glycosylase n=1 Tax=Rubellimicrobium rubrum TaxID=2585369 RepID=A0A5C4MTP4_9RHOB|nr:uracil-DNA glycosylase [Rubellimicrobium rubrum]TNC49007.1 uracil-DNA glycosylase [Rubellimicrobium rubrum]
MTDAPLLACPAEIARRRAMLQEPAFAPLAAYAAGLRAILPGLVPDMDPFDGGPAAWVLLLLEKPGPQAARTGFVSRDNPSPTSAAIRMFLKEAGLLRGDTLLWNTVPAWNGTIRVTGAEVADGMRHLATLWPLLPRLDTVVLVGARARRAAGLVPSGLRVLRSDHPSPQVRAAFPARWSAISAAWSEAAHAPTPSRPRHD